MPSTRFKGFALIDCNSFYVSCEKVFKPHLKHRPALVLSNNDGCVIAASKEAKKWGIFPGTPLFKCASLLQKHQIEVFSPNFALYADMSDRVMKILYDFSDQMEIYSIDEAFIPITSQKLEDFIDLQKKVKQWTGIPISIGLAQTKTRAKLALYLAKERGLPLYSLLETKDVSSIFKEVPIEAVWGIGRKLTEKLKKNGIFTAADFCECPKEWVRKKFHLLGLRTLLELHGTVCIPSSLKEELQKSLTYSNTFGSPIESFEKLSEAISHYTSRAVEKLRARALQAQMITLYLKTPLFSHHRSMALNSPTSFTPHFIEAAQKLLKQMYQKEKYKKAAIYLFELTSQKEEQLDFRLSNTSKHSLLMKTLDQINQHYGKDTLFYASEGFEKPWLSKRDHLSPEYTTKFSEILKIKI